MASAAQAQICAVNERFSINWNTVNWPRGSTNETISLTNGNGYVVNMEVTFRGVNGVYIPFPAGNDHPGFDPVVGGFAGNVDDLSLIWDPVDANPSPVFIEVRFDSEVRDVQFLVTDIDEAANNSSPFWRMDRVVVTGTNAAGDSVIPTLAPVSGTPTLVVTNNLATAFDGAGSSGNDDFGSVSVDFAPELNRIVIQYDERAPVADPAARGIGVLGNLSFCPAPWLKKKVVSPPSGRTFFGDTLQFEISITNQADVAMTTLALNDIYDSNTLVFVNSVPTPSLPGSGNLTWNNLAPIPPFGGTSVVLNFTVNSNGLCSTETNRVIGVPSAPLLTVTSEAPYRVVPPIVSDISGRVLRDQDEDGFFDPQETNGIPGVTLLLTDTNGLPLATNITGILGTYLFTNIPGGHYFVREIDPAGASSTADTDGGDPNQIAVTMFCGTNSVSNNFLDTLALNVADWSREMKITFCGNTDGGTLTNFPAYMIFSQAAISNFFYADFASPAGYDLIFTDDTKTQPLSYEVQSWNTNGISLFWVKVPLMTGTTTCVYAYWGNPLSTHQKAIGGVGFLIGGEHILAISIQGEP
ncbi:MAG: DUF2341 domain-containing protein, partial [Verrucomicrobiota bacterium]